MIADKTSPTLRAIETIMELKKENEFLKLSNQRLLSENEKLRDFIAMAAHELRNPICPILGSIEVIEEKVGNKKEDIRDDKRTQEKTREDKRRQEREEKR